MYFALVYAAWLSILLVLLCLSCRAWFINIKYPIVHLTMAHFLLYYGSFPIILWRISYHTMAHFLLYYGSFPIVLWLISYHTMAHFLLYNVFFLSYYQLFCHCWCSSFRIPYTYYSRKSLLVFSPTTRSVAMAYPFKWVRKPKLCMPVW